MRKNFNFALLICLVVSLFLTGCAGKMTPSQAEEYLAVMLPNGDKSKKYPVVFFLQGSDGSNWRAATWSRWFNEHGVATVMIDSAGIMKRKSLMGMNYGDHLAHAVDAVKDNRSLDLSHYAVMGFSRGGTASLKSANYLLENQPKPEFIFSLYPGDNSICPNSHGDQTEVHVFYGGLDDWGTYQGNRDACKRMASKYENATFHLLQGAHHGYDGNWTGSYQCCGGRTFRKIPNSKALDETKNIILKAVKEKWTVE